MSARKLNVLIFATIFNCIVGIVFIGVALGTNHWFDATAVDPSNQLITVTVKYGIFKGWKEVCNDRSCQRYDITLTCSGNSCMYSCGKSSSDRKTDLSNLENDSPVAIDSLCIVSSTRMNQTNRNVIPRQESTNVEKKWLNFGLLVTTLFFFGLTMIFNIVSGVFALYNTYRAPMQPILSVFGLYVWNGISAVSLLLGMILWGVVHATILSKNAAISQTLQGASRRFETKDAVTAYSYWLLLPALLLCLANLAILKFRAWKIVKMEEKNVKVMNETLDNGDILLF